MSTSRHTASAPGRLASPFDQHDVAPPRVLAARVAFPTVRVAFPTVRHPAHPPPDADLAETVPRVQPQTGAVLREDVRLDRPDAARLRGPDQAGEKSVTDPATVMLGGSTKIECSTTPAYTGREETEETAAHPTTRSPRRATNRGSARRAASNPSQLGGSASKVASSVAIPAWWICATAGQSDARIGSITTSCLILLLYHGLPGCIARLLSKG
jgi:hypothetical protein